MIIHHGNSGTAVQIELQRCFDPVVLDSHLYANLVKKMLVEARELTTS